MQEREDECRLRRASKVMLRHSPLLSKQEAMKGSRVLWEPSTGQQTGRQAGVSTAVRLGNSHNFSESQFYHLHNGDYGSST